MGEEFLKNEVLSQSMLDQVTFGVSKSVEQLFVSLCSFRQQAARAGVRISCLDCSVGGDET